MGCTYSTSIHIICNDWCIVTSKLHHPYTCLVSVSHFLSASYTMVADESCLRLMEHYSGYVEDLSEVSSTPGLISAEAQYQKKVEALLNDENCYNCHGNHDHYSFSLRHM